MVISCKVYKLAVDGKEKGCIVRIPDPKENLRDALVALKRELHLPGDTELATEEGFTKAGYLCVTDMRGNGLDLFSRLKAKPKFRPREEERDAEGNPKKLKKLRISWLNRHRCTQARQFPGLRPAAVVAEALVA